MAPKRVQLVFLGIFFVLSGEASAYLEKRFAFDLQFGFPQIFQGQAAFLPFKRLQVGVGYLPFPASISITSGARIPAQIELVDGYKFYLEARDDTSFDTLPPFVRYFPVPDRNFYFMLSYPMIRGQTTIHMSLVSVVEPSLRYDDIIQVSMLIAQPFPTLSIGHIFATNFFYINLTMGYAYIGDVRVSNLKITGEFPSVNGGNANNEAALAALVDNAVTQANQGTSAARLSFGVIPSIYFAIGFFI